MAASLMTASWPTVLPRHQCFRSSKPAVTNACSGHRLHVVSALPSPVSAAWKESVWKTGRAALLAAVVSTGMCIVPPDAHLLLPAHADEEASLSSSQRRANANDRRKAILAKTRENALNRGELFGGDEGVPADIGADLNISNVEPPRGTTSMSDVKPEQPQLKTEQPAPEAVTPALPKMPAPELPKSSLPDKLNFSMPSKPLQPPPSPGLSAPNDVPKTESPVLPVPTPQLNKSLFQAPTQPQTSSAPAAPSAGGGASSGSSQGFNWADFTRGKEPEKKQTTILEDTKAAASKQQAKVLAAAEKVDPRLAKRHGLPLFLVQLLLTGGLGAALYFAVTKYDAMMANSFKLEKAIIELLEQVQKPLKSTEKRTEV